MTETEARAVCDRWLPRWTGNRPDELLACYHEDTRYRDPGRPDGLRGHAELRRYFERLLAANPDWSWSAREVIPTAGGFTLRWAAAIPVGGETVNEEGLDIVEVDADGLITRNEVFFDRTALLAAHAAAAVAAGEGEAS